MKANLKAVAAHALYPLAGRLLRLYLVHFPIRRGKPWLLNSWYERVNWRRNCTFTASSREGIRFGLNMVDSVSSHPFLTGVWESGITEFMAALLKPGDVFIDVGANIGYHSLLAAKLVGARGRVFAIEPAPHIRAVFEQNVALNPDLAAQDNIMLIPYCASDRAGTVVLSAPAGGNSGETTRRTVLQNAVTMRVEARTLDGMLAGVDLSRCPLLKMDIEGAEYLAVTGMESTLDRHPGISLMLEVDDRFLRDRGHSSEQLLRWFEGKGYHSYTIAAPRSNLLNEPVVLLPQKDAPESPENVLFTRQPERFARWIAPPAASAAAGPELQQVMGNLIRVLYFYPYLQFNTGSPKALVQYIDALDRSLFAPVFYAIGRGPLVEELVSRGVEIIGGKSENLTWRRPLAGASAVLRCMAALRKARIDLLHVNGFFWNVDLVIAAWLLRIPVLLHVHLPSSADFQNLHRFAARKVLFCSHFEMKNFEHPERLAGKSEVVHNTTDVARFARAKSIREALGVGENEIAIGTVAQIMERKGIDIVIEAARSLAAERKDLVFLIAGPVPSDEEAYARRMAAAAEDPVFGGRVRFMGSRSDIPEFLASLDLFLLPTRKEPFGIAVLEAMASGLPVIASAVGGIPEMITSPDLGVLVDSLDPFAFAQAVRNVLVRPDRGRSMGANARASAERRFDQAVMTTRLRDIYLELVPGARQTRSGGGMACHADL